MRKVIKFALPLTIIVFNSFCYARKHNKNEKVVSDTLKYDRYICDTSSSTIDAVLNNISKISRVKSTEKRILNNSNGKQHLSYIIREAPSMEFPFYWIQVGVNNELRFEVLLNFHVSCQTREIYYFDSNNEKRIPLKEWEGNR